MVLPISQNPFLFKNFFANAYKVVIPIISFIGFVYVIYDVLSNHDPIKQLSFCLVAPLIIVSSAGLSVLSTFEFMDKDNSKRIKWFHFIMATMNGGLSLLVIFIVAYGG